MGSGTSDTTFSPNQAVTREQIAVILMAFAAQVPGAERPAAPADLAAFPDGAQVSGWARDAMADAVALGVLGGAEVNGTLWLRPQGQATRAEVATVLAGFGRSVAHLL